MIIICNLQRIIDYCEEQATLHISKLLLGEEDNNNKIEMYVTTQHRLEYILLTIRRGHGFLLRI